MPNRAGPCICHIRREKHAHDTAMVRRMLKKIWQPVRIGSVEIPNRVARAANTTTMFPFPIGEDFAAYHEARARAGVGLTILEAGSVHPNSQIAYLVDESALPGYEKLMAACRPHGMKVFQQLWHGGHNLGGKDGAMPWSASATPSPLTGIIGVEMGRADIGELTDAFARAAGICKRAGLDGVEIHAGHGYIFSQFLSPLTNERTDEYNGDLIARARFLREVLTAVRAEVGKGFAMGARVSASTAVGGLSAEDVAALCAHLEELNLIDFIDISYSDYFQISSMASSMAFPSGYQLPVNAPISEAVKRVPRIVTGRYRTLEEAEQVLNEGLADMVSLVRAQIADPELVRKTREGRPEDVRPCIACNQGCVGGLLTIGKMQCTVNPAAGYEALLDETRIARVEKPRKVLIVGGGPSGMEAARIAALKGHSVILAEAGAALGGQLLGARRAPYLHILGDLVEWLERQVYALGVDVRISTYLDAADICEIAPDVVILATGALPREDGRQTLIPGELPAGVGLPHVYDPLTLALNQPIDLHGKSAVVFDDVGRYEAIACADIFQKAGADVTFVTSMVSFGPRMMGSNREHESFQRLSRGGPFRLIVNHNLLAVRDGECDIRAQGTRSLQTIRADILALRLNQMPNAPMFEELRGHIPEMVRVGDALSPRDLLAAMHDGHRAARAI